MSGVTGGMVQRTSLVLKKTLRKISCIDFKHWFQTALILIRYKYLQHSFPLQLLFHLSPTNPLRFPSFFPFTHLFPFLKKQTKLPSLFPVTSLSLSSLSSLPSFLCFLLASWGEHHICPLPLSSWLGKPCRRPVANTRLFLLLICYIYIKFVLSWSLHIPIVSVTAASPCRVSRQNREMNVDLPKLAANWWSCIRRCRQTEETRDRNSVGFHWSSTHSHLASETKKRNSALTPAAPWSYSKITASVYDVFTVNTEITALCGLCSDN